MSEGRVFSRRGLLRGVAGTVAILPPLAAAGRAFAVEARLLQSRDRDPGDDDAWRDVLEAFERGRVIPMNTANLAPAPRPVRASLKAFSDSIDADPSFQNRAQFAETRAFTREQLAGYLRVDEAEVAITRNTTEGNNFVVQGLDLGPDDHVVLSAHNHPSNRAAWHTRARRHGFSVTEVDLESPPSGPESLLDDLRAATTPSTRVISFSHVTNLGGCRYPAPEICAWARERDIFTIIDGAQSGGALDLDLHAIGCDAFTASSHKWFCGPREAGVLYVRSEAQERLWSTIVGVGHDGAEGARRLESLGQRDDAAVAAFGHAVEMFQRIGSAAIEARIAALTDHLKAGLTHVGGVRLYTPLEPSFSGGVVTFQVAGAEPRAAHQWLYEARGIAGAPSGVGDGGIRLSPHVYNSLEDCERALAAVREIAAGAV